MAAFVLFEAEDAAARDQLVCDFADAHAREIEVENAACLATGAQRGIGERLVVLVADELEVIFLHRGDEVDLVLLREMF